MQKITACHRDNSKSVIVSYLLVFFSLSITIAGIICIVYSGNSDKAMINATTSCVSWGYGSERYGQKCYDSLFQPLAKCTTPCTCMKIDFSVDCLPYPKSSVINILMIFGIVFLVIGVIAVIVTTYFVSISFNKWQQSLY